MIDLEAIFGDAPESATGIVPASLAADNAPALGESAGVPTPEAITSELVPADEVGGGPDPCGFLDAPGIPASPSLDIMEREDFEYVVYPEAQGERDFWLGGGGPQYDPMTLPRNRAPRMPWGRHRGRRVEQVPLDYLEWMGRKGIRLNGEIQVAIDKKLGSEAGPTDKPVAQEAGYCVPRGSVDV